MALLASAEPGDADPPAPAWQSGTHLSRIWSTNAPQNVESDLAGFEATLTDPFADLLDVRAA